MSTKNETSRASTLSYWLLVAFVTILWVAGGASRADVLGQSVIRFVAWIIAVIAILWLPKVNWRTIREPVIMLVLAVLMVTLQLIPLPPSLWIDLPGREIFVQAATLSNREQPWRPLSISPSGTSNSLSSLVVPAVVFLLISNLSPRMHEQISRQLLGLAIAGAVIGVLQFSGSDFTNPLINTVPGTVTGTFSNRNHFALFLAIGCVLAIFWASGGEKSHWKLWAGLAVAILFSFTALASGSRSGALIVILAVITSGLAVRNEVAIQTKQLSKRVVAAVLMSVITVISLLAWLSVALGRAVSVERALSMDATSDLRWDIWPVVGEMIAYYAPFGTGFGSFDPAFRIHEPHSMLNVLYVNLAHNDWMQIALEGGFAAGALLAGSVVWFGKKSFQVFVRPKNTTDNGAISKMGVLIIVLVLTAGATDYAARTPMIMAILAIAASWVSLDGRLNNQD